MPRFSIPLIFLCGVLLGCHPEKNDSHTEVFKTSDQLATDRRKQLLRSHQDLAIAVVKFARPDVQVQAADAGVMVQADGLEKQIDLLPIEDELMHQPNRERPIISRYLEQQLRPFDQQRLDAAGFEKVRALVKYHLLSQLQLEQMKKDYPRSPICSAAIVPNLIRATVVQSHGTETPVDQAMLKAWHVSDAALDAAVGAVLRQTVAQAGTNLFETINYPTFGDCGTLKVDVAVIVIPEFLAAVQKQWNTTDDLVISIPSLQSVQFAASHNEKLLTLLAPQWTKVVASLKDPLYRLLLLRSSDAMVPYVFTPATKPATKPASKPETYFVH